MLIESRLHVVGMSLDFHGLFYIKNSVIVLFTFSMISLFSNNTFARRVSGLSKVRLIDEKDCQTGF